jgi:hypothetical protein
MLMSLIAGSLLLVSSTFSQESKSSVKSRPNIVFFLADDMDCNFDEAHRMRLNYQLNRWLCAALDLSVLIKNSAVYPAIQAN